MPRMLGINIGFVTNSSSVVYHFPRQLLDNPEVKKFIETFELSDGFIGSDLWSRNTCSTIAMTREQKKQVVTKLARDDDYGTPPGIDTEDDSVLIIFGDEYQSIAATLAEMLRRVAQEQGLTIHSDEYN